MTSTPSMPFFLNIKVKMEPIEEMITKNYIIEFHQKIDRSGLKMKELLNSQLTAH